tara:strand:- start:45 stop:467 length:423 start_codon:yes stop_codon:yes gene_type:complete
MFKNARQFGMNMRQKLGVNARKNVKDALEKSVNEVRNVAVESIVRNPRRGAEVRRRGQTFNISRAGDPPAQDQGFLSSQISVEVKMSSTGGIGKVISAAPYSAALEFGTVNMGARPFMQPALKKSQKKILQIFKREGIVK